MADKVYWTMKDGRKINVDDMDMNHLRNALKMLIRTANSTAIQKANKKPFEVNGELAQIDADNYEIYKNTGMLPEDFDEDLFWI
jgi:hypothetical protein